MRLKNVQHTMATLHWRIFRYPEQLKAGLPLLPCVLIAVMIGAVFYPGNAGMAQTTYQVEACAKWWTDGTCGPKTGPFGSLKCAVENAAPGSKINLECGNYMETLKTQKRLTLTASGGTARIGMRRDHLWAGVNSGDIFDVPDEPIGFVTPDKTLGAMLDTLVASNLRVIRIIIDYRLDLDRDGIAKPKGEYNDRILEAIDHLMFEMQKRGLLLQIAFESHNWMNDYLIYTNRDAQDYETEIGDNMYNTWYAWRRCRTPQHLFRTITDSASSWPETASTDFEENRLCRRKPGKEAVIKILCKSPHRQRIEAGEFTEDESDEVDLNYFTNRKMIEFFKMRVEHILNHKNIKLGNKKWKDINDVIWAWGLHSEPGYMGVGGKPDDILPWLHEMSAYIKGIDPDTYLALGTRGVNPKILKEHFVDIDIYTIHAYQNDFPEQKLKDTIRQFKSPQGIGGKYGKLLLIEEFGSTTDYVFEFGAEMQVPWMFWEFNWDKRGWSNWPEKDPELWNTITTYANKSWNTPNCLCKSASLPWRVGEMVDALSSK